MSLEITRRAEKDFNTAVWRYNSTSCINLVIKISNLKLHIFQSSGGIDLYLHLNHLSSSHMLSWLDKWINEQAYCTGIRIKVAGECICPQSITELSKSRDFCHWWLIQDFKTSLLTVCWQNCPLIRMPRALLMSQWTILVARFSIPGYQEPLQRRGTLQFSPVIHVEAGNIICDK